MSMVSLAVVAVAEHRKQSNLSPISDTGKPSGGDRVVAIVAVSYASMSSKKQGHSLRSGRSRTKSTSSSISGSRTMQETHVPRVKRPARLTELECNALIDVFTYFDTDCVGALPREEAYRICCMLGLNIARSSIPAVVKRSEFLAFVDSNMIAAVGPTAEAEVLATTICNGIHSPSTQAPERITASAIRDLLEENNVAHSVSQVEMFVELLSPYDQVRTDRSTDPPYILAEDFIEGVAHTMAKEASKYETRRPRPYTKY